MIKYKTKNLIYLRIFLFCYIQNTLNEIQFFSFTVIIFSFTIVTAYYLLLAYSPFISLISNPDTSLNQKNNQPTYYKIMQIFYFVKKCNPIKCSPRIIFNGYRKKMQQL